VEHNKIKVKIFMFLSDFTKTVPRCENLKKNCQQRGWNLQPIEVSTVLYHLLLPATLYLWVWFLIVNSVPVLCPDADMDEKNIAGMSGIERETSLRHHMCFITPLL
jgi:hypothetical protein